ncbi:hypothetical protein H0E87_024097 [Populus deltoides]|jgi:hypothetical protein|uniref:PGG domain-containing protein n=1 Tax=Populus deltoides TaxID=3696 RepID=A0A8T2X857_POPDE|nr:hypothetical protein H0E87_024097 [Populus deltoides]
MENHAKNTTSTRIKSKIKVCFKFIAKPTRPPWEGDLKPETDHNIRNVLLVGTALIATVTFQAGISPPGGVWQSDDKLGHKAGRAIYSDQRIPFQIFLLCNTIALTSSSFLLLCLTFRYPYFLEVFIATISMMGTYGSAIYCVTPYESVSFRLIFLAAPVPMVIRVLIWVFSAVFYYLVPNEWLKKIGCGRKEPISVR